MLGLETMKRASYVFLARTNFIAISLTVFFQLYTRSAAVTHFIVGVTTCMISVKLLKRIIKQPRPQYVEVPTAGPGKTKRRKKLTYGMPSTHSACITFYAYYICCACFYLPLHPTLQPLNAWIPFGLKTSIPPFAILWATSVIYSRVWMEHHTFPQVIVGALWGGLCSAPWFALWTRGGVSVIGNQIEDRVWRALAF